MNREEYLQRLEREFRAYVTAVRHYSREDDSLRDDEVNETRHVFLLTLGLEDKVLGRKKITPILQLLVDEERRSVKKRYNSYDPSTVVGP